MQSLTLEQVREEKRKAENEIRQVLRSFNVNTGITRISLTGESVTMQFTDDTEDVVSFNVEITAKI